MYVQIGKTKGFHRIPGILKEFLVQEFHKKSLRQISVPPPLETDPGSQVHEAVKIMSSSMRGAILRHYRELMEAIACIPKEAERAGAREQARAVIRANKDIANPVEVFDKLKEMVAKISFLRITNPRDPSRLRRRESCSSGSA